MASRGHSTSFIFFLWNDDGAKLPQISVLFSPEIISKPPVMNENLNENEMENISQNQPEADLPQNSVETPAESMVEPTESPAEETVAEVLVEEAPAEEVVAEAPVNMVQEETSAEEMLAEAPSEEIPEEILVEEKPATETVAVTEEVETIADDDEHGLADFAEAANDDADLESKTKKELLDEFYAVTKEGNPIFESKNFVQFYGMSSDTAMEKHHGGVAEYRSSEGRTVKVPYKGTVAKTIQDILGGVRSTCTYVGAKSLKDLSKCTTFVRVNKQFYSVFVDKR
jgi:hypothetical protein